MGRVRDLAGKRTFAALAKELVEAADVGASNHEKKRANVRNHLHKLDEGDDFDWWGGTGERYRGPLCERLRIQEANFETELRPRKRAQPAATVWEFAVFDGLGAIDLTSDPLFPGLPRELTRQGGPEARHTWWTAPRGAGKTLLGRWLEARYGWATRSAHSWNDIRRELPRSGRLYVELETTEGAPQDPEADLPPDLRVCVAAPDRPPVAGADTTQAAATWDAATLPNRVEDSNAPAIPATLWSEVFTPPATEWMPRLVDWVAQRLQSGGGFVGARLHALIASGAEIPAETPGEALEWFSAIERCGLDPKKPEYLVAHWIRGAAARPEHAVPDGMAHHLKKNGYLKLVRAAEDRMREGRSTRLSSSEWDALLRGSDPQPEVAEIMSSLEAAKTLEAARNLMVPPGRLWREAFQAIHLLHDTGDGLVVRPEWLARTVDQLAFERLIAGAPGLGALLLHADTALKALGYVRRDAQVDADACVKRALVEAASGTPEALALLDATVRAAGLLAELSPELARFLWEKAMTLAEQRWPGLPPLPVLSVAEVDRWYGPSSLGAWYLAMLVLSLRAGTTSRPGTALDPWRTAPSGDERVRLEEALTHVDSAVRGPPGDDEGNPELRSFRAAAIALGSQLLDTLGVLRRHGQLLHLQTAPILVALAQGRTLELSDAERSELLQLRFGLGVLRETCAARGVELNEVLVWCWDTWASDSNGAAPPYLWRRSERDEVRDDARALWRALPCELLTASGAPEGGFDDHYVWRALCNDAELMAMLHSPPWEAWLERWSKDPLRSTYGETMFEHLPEELVSRALTDGAVNAFCHDVRTVLWRRMPDGLMALVDELAKVEPRTTYGIPGHGGPILDLVWSAPEDRVGDFVKRAGDWLVDPAQYRGTGPWARAWLLSVVAERRPGWRVAFAHLRRTRST